MLDGRSLVPLLQQTGEFSREAVFWHFPAYLQGSGADCRTTPAGAVRSGDFKLLEFFEDGRLELYNLAADIGEKSNLAGEMPEKTNELHELLLKWRTSVEAPMPQPNPKYDPDAKRADKQGKRKARKASR